MSSLSKYAKPGFVDKDYNTRLSPAEEKEFNQRVKDNKVTFDSKAPVTDYDMRGFYRGLQGGDPMAKSAIDPNDNRLHYPDYWKTPYHETFSNESQWATPDAPSWNDQDQLIDKDGTVVFDDKAQKYADGGFVARKEDKKPKPDYLNRPYGDLTDKQRGDLYHALTAKDDTDAPSPEAIELRRRIQEGLQNDPVARYGYDPTKFHVESTKDYGTLGDYNRKEDKIRLDPAFLNSDLAGTILHESRHRAFKRLSDNEKYWNKNAAIISPQNNLAFKESIDNFHTGEGEEVVNRIFDQRKRNDPLAEHYLKNVFVNRATGQPKFEAYADIMENTINPPDDGDVGMKGDGVVSSKEYADGGVVDAAVDPNKRQGFLQQQYADLANADRTRALKQTLDKQELTGYADGGQVDPFIYYYSPIKGGIVKERSSVLYGHKGPEVELGGGTPGVNGPNTGDNANVANPSAIGSLAHGLGTAAVTGFMGGIPAGIVAAAKALYGYVSSPRANEDPDPAPEQGPPAPGTVAAEAPSPDEGQTGISGNTAPGSQGPGNPAASPGLGDGTNANGNTGNGTGTSGGSNSNGSGAGGVGDAGDGNGGNYASGGFVKKYTCHACGGPIMSEHMAQGGFIGRPNMANPPQPNYAQGGQVEQSTEGPNVAATQVNYAQGGGPGQAQAAPPISPQLEQAMPPSATADNVPAKLSQGEFVMDAATVRFFGAQKLIQMQEKAHQALEAQVKANGGQLPPPNDPNGNAPKHMQNEATQPAPQMPTQVPPNGAAPFMSMAPRTQPQASTTGPFISH